jgi:hypothetical protein
VKDREVLRFTISKVGRYKKSTEAANLQIPEIENSERTSSLESKEWSECSYQESGSNIADKSTIIAARPEFV